MTPSELRARLKPLCPALDVHVHPPGDFGFEVESVEQEVRLLIEPAQRAGVAKMCLFGVGKPPAREPTIEQCVESNDYVRAMRDAAPEWFLPFCYLTPAHADESADEMSRCVSEHGFCGVKLWVARCATEQCLDPIMRRAVELDVPVLQHSWIKTGGGLPGESLPRDVADLARRHPDARIIMAHLDGCGVRGLEAVAPYPNVHVDTGGGDPLSGMVATAVEMLGPRRVCCGSDGPIRHFGVVLGKTLGSGLTDGIKRNILWNNAARLLPPWAGVEPLEEGGQ